MRCPTCRERIPAAAPTCPACGGRRPRAPYVPVAQDGGVRRCQRCGYRGDGVGYFSRPGHVFLIFALGAVTYGIGALVYWLARRHNLVCPNCGLDWQHSRLLAEPDPAPRERLPTAVVEERGRLPRGGGFRQFVGALLVLGGLSMLAAGVLVGEIGLLIGAVGAGMPGVALSWWGFAARDNRRLALRARMQTRILRMAGRRGGTLTVSDVASEFGIGLPAAERILIGMEDGLRVRSEIDPEGVIVYEFPEMMRRPALEPPHLRIEPE